MPVTQPKAKPQDSKRFLETLSPTGQFTFVALPERSDIKARGRCQELHGTWHDFEQKLTDLNAAGYGIFVTINEGDGHGRKAANIVRVRAHFIDLDGAPIQPVLQAAQPHMVVETSPGRWHVYWLTNDCPLDQFKPRQRQIAEKFGGDKSVCDLPRVMRLPGFLHQKHAQPFLTQLLLPVDWKKIMEAPQ